MRNDVESLLSGRRQLRGRVSDGLPALPGPSSEEMMTRHAWLLIAKHRHDGQVPGIGRAGRHVA